MNEIAATAEHRWDKVSDREWARVLESLPLFEGIGKRDLRRIVRDAEFAEFPPGESVVLSGERGDAFYLVLGGEATAPAKPAHRTLTTGDYFGEISLLDGEPRSATVIATSDLHVMRLRRRAFDQMLERHPSLARKLLVELGTRVRMLERQAARPTT
jgi:CRP/FNR family transcriptional regulator, cyclic AMP receptor protein